MAADLGFARVAENSLDAVADARLRRSTTCRRGAARRAPQPPRRRARAVGDPEFGFVRLPDAYSGGSSIMPQKKNPDAAELMRAAAPRLAADLGGLLGVLHGLPLAYNTDLREDKRYLFDAVDCLDAAAAGRRAACSRSVTFDERRMAAACDPFLAATDVADYLVERGVPFREAHHLTGALVRRCLEPARTLAQVPLEELRALSPALRRRLLRPARPAAQLARKRSRGGSAPARVREQLELARAASPRAPAAAEPPPAQRLAGAAAVPVPSPHRPLHWRVTSRPLQQSFFARPALDVARDLIGCTFLLGGAGGRIVETEAYRQDDPAATRYRGRTRATP